MLLESKMTLEIKVLIVLWYVRYCWEKASCHSHLGLSIVRSLRSLESSWYM